MTTLSRTIRRRLPRDIERRQWVGLMSGAGVAFRRVRSPRVTPVVPWEQIWLAAMKLSAEELRRERLEKRARGK
jgi:hypothetical protein